MIGSLLSIGGALIILFSWLVTNTLLERAKGAKAALVTSETHYRLVSMLNELRAGQDSLASEIKGIGQLLSESDKAEKRYVGVAPIHPGEHRQRLERAQVNARQIKHGRDFVEAEMDRYSDSAPDNVQNPLLGSFEALHQLSLEIEREFDRASEILGGKRELTSDDVARLGAIHERYSATLLPRFGPLLKTAVDASNRGRELLRNVEKRAHRNWVRFRFIALLLYILGSALVVSGTVYKDLVPAREHSPTAIAKEPRAT